MYFTVLHTKTCILLYYRLQYMYFTVLQTTVLVFYLLHTTIHVFYCITYYNTSTVYSGIKSAPESDPH